MSQRNIHIAYAFALPAAVVALSLALPAHITMVAPDLEDLHAYLAALEIQSKKEAVQEALPEKEEVVELYDGPVYMQITDTCDWSFSGECVYARTGPGAAYEKAYLYYERLGAFAAALREGQVFAMSALITSTDGSLWYKVDLQTDKLLFPGRIRTDWYVPADRFARVDLSPINPEQDAVKRIVISLRTQELFAYEGEKLFMKTSISSGQSRLGLATSMGNFRIFRKTPFTIMEGPLPGMAYMVNPSNLIDFEYTLFVPFAMAFEASPMGTSFIHEAYWHNGFGTERSHGCVNVSYQDALTLYNWTPDPAIIKIPVTVIPR